MITFLAVIHILACLGLIGLVMIQDSKGGGVFASQSSSNSLLGAGGATTLAQNATKVMAFVFAATCITLSIIAAKGEKSVVEGGVIPTTPVTAAPANPAPTETAPATTPAPEQPKK